MRTENSSLEPAQALKEFACSEIRFMSAGGEPLFPPINSERPNI
jgi:hypothetical protein